MKIGNAFLGLILLICSFVGFGQQYEIAVKANQIVPNKKIYLEYVNVRGQAIKVDSALPNAQNSVKFSGKVLDNGAFYLVNFFDVTNPQKVLLILEGGEKVEIQADGVNLPEKPGGFTLKGNTPALQQMTQVLSISKSLEEKVKTWNQELQQNPKSQKQIQTEFERSQKETLAKIKALIPAMGTSLVALWATNFLPIDSELATLEEIGERFKTSRPNHPQVRPFLENLKRLKGVAIGNEAPEISLPTPTGERLALSSLRGKYVLLDFWASWCGPCRQENPNVVKTYAKYKDSGFEILGISLDKDKNAWLKAIENDQLTWKHVSDLQYWNSVAAQAYQVNAIPMTYLVGPDGKIVAKGLRGPSLESYLSELFKK